MSRRATGLLTRGSPSAAFPVVASGVVAEGISPHSGGTVPDSHRVPLPLAGMCGRAYHRAVEPKEVGDRQLDALLERLDALTAELRSLNRRLDSGDNLAPVVHELRSLKESLQALAYAALGQQGPQVRRRRSG